ncbi:hypothetical protein J2752_000480 [Halarchaeum rubridurum]|uniref:Uncharacterized protein n=1 Tax=Halarchaeum rubridurum TaxID=489911 RepID=A0A830FM85_9EURY|nr:hypothetical protein [Halarchaeum rubridurum]MBP1953599.1 hypothetical protein [Halarchaeum rubridurum]GGM64046.1 hypothetical protein GCM10009017_12640 [Halarchaeum rubridurum]
MHTTPRRPDNDSDATVQQLDRTLYDVPATWAEWGSHEPVRDGETRFHAIKLCHTYAFVTKRVSGSRANADERNQIHVLYEDPETGDRVERVYDASLIEAHAETIHIWSQHAEAPDGRMDYPGLPVMADGFGEGFLVVPRIVRRGGPESFAASVAVRDDEPRLSEGGN